VTEIDPASRLARALARIDAANAEDPNELVVGGRRGPKELLHAELVTGWVTRLDPGADEAQLLAARAHHFRRWTHPRDAYPAGRAGYLRWRTAAKRHQAAEVAAVLAEEGYDSATIERVGALVRKEGLGRDPAVQTHEDALCLVFLETQLADVAPRLGDDDTVRVLAAALGKMSDAGRSAATGIPLDPASRALLARAVAAATGSGEETPSEGCAPA
jgi:hypothetical protein